jgi:multidrug transporter EmrE-like cation transporter
MIINIGLFCLYVAVSSFGLYKLKGSGGVLTLDSAVGFGFYGLGFLVWYYVLTRLPLSIAFPIAAGSLIIATQLVGYGLLGEKIGLVQIGGITLIIAGISLIHIKA